MVMRETGLLEAQTPSCVARAAYPYPSWGSPLVQGPTGTLPSVHYTECCTLLESWGGWEYDSTCTGHSVDDGVHDQLAQPLSGLSPKGAGGHDLVTIVSFN